MEKNRVFYNVRLGVHPINWCNDDMDYLGDQYSFEDIIDQAQEAGYAGIELGRKFPREVKALRRALARRGLVLTSGWCDTMFAHPELRGKFMEEFKEKARFLADMGTSVVVAAEGTHSTCWDPTEDRRKLGVQKLNEEEWKRFADGLNEAGAFCRDLGTRLVYHVHTGTVVESYSETKQLCELTDPKLVNLLADTGHLHYCGVDLEAFYRDFFHRIKYIHLKDIRPTNMQMVKAFGLDFNSAVQVDMFTVPGDGCIDYPAIMDILEEKGYMGWMVVEAEQYLNSPTALEFAQMAREYIRGLTGL